MGFWNRPGSESCRVTAMIKWAASLFLNISLLAGFFLMVSIKEAHAYIDAGSAAFVVQMALASLIGGLLGLKVFWHNIIGKLSKILSMFSRD